MHGIVRILMDLPELTGITREIGFGELARHAAAGVSDGVGPWDAAATEAFAQERVRFALEQRGYPPEIVRAATPSTNPVPLRARRVAEALQTMRTSQDFQALAVLFKRVKNISRELKTVSELDRSALTEAAEVALLTALDERRPRVGQAVAAADYTGAFAEIAGLRPAVDRFFTEVFVMADDARVRTARLTLATALRDLILDLADISEIVPHTE